MIAISKLEAYQIYDSRGKPTIEVSLHTESGDKFYAAVPSGASTGIHEALELRDNDKNSFLGQGIPLILTPISNINILV